MSYYTRVEIELERGDGRVVDVEAIVARAEAYVQEAGYHEDVLSDLRAALTGDGNHGAGFNNMRSDLIIDLIAFLSREFPETSFFVRGTGEELHDVWLREFRGGLITFCRGPWDEVDRKPGPGYWVRTNPYAPEFQELKARFEKAEAQASRLHQSRTAKQLFVLACFGGGLLVSLLLWAVATSKNQSDAKQRELDASMGELRRQLSSGEVEGGEAIKRLLGVEEGGKPSDVGK